MAAIFFVVEMAHVKTGTFFGSRIKAMVTDPSPFQANRLFHSEPTISDRS